MKKINLIIILALTIFACKNETKQNVDLEENRAKSYDQNDGFITIKGDFVYFADAAVLQTPKEIYGVVIDENMHVLNKQAKAFKSEPTDMVPVTVRVRKFKKEKNEEGWPYRVEIKEILKVEAPDPNKEDVIKLAN
ncbi:hypothetical protein [Winogradskyella sediminis]|uniref:NlpE C-terminal OB domain-containing protein n=1 Tax=Winogradskyella sediminis TaxID=1382466 RepID=A0A1H1RFH7_9FLAO|nr:hypothetical protein [Winogradskyella sediminis]REG89533.1 hypothetical protein C8N41_101775 [Winogradskyella sediminis]SDS34514.1 hypothetical protein SAMN04489797_1401 [Winogradskyella sediminis]